MKDLQIIEALLNGNHLNREELLRANDLIASMLISIKGRLL